MSLSFDSAVRSLAGSATAASDDRLNERLDDVQQLLRHDLQMVERVLADAVASGTQPAVAAANHLIAGGGKRVRPTAVLLSAACFGEVSRAVVEMAAVVELVHSATLLHDDVIDDGDERRGSETARRLWGNAVSVLAGDTLLVESLQRTSRHAPALMGELLDTLSRLVAGEVVQLRGRREVDLSEATYERILADKTASLFRFATLAGSTLSGADEKGRAALSQFGERLGMAFQLVDDVLDYTGAATGKTLCADLLEGKVTLPLVLAAKSDSTLLDQVQAIRAGSHDLVGQLRASVVATGACEMVRQRARQETQRALAALEHVAPGAPRHLLEGVARQLAGRES